MGLIPCQGHRSRDAEGPSWQRSFEEGCTLAFAPETDEKGRI